MVTMTVPVSAERRASWLPSGRELTADDLEHAPDDGWRYELIDGLLVVSPAPIVIHQRAVTRLILALGPAVPAEYELFVAPFDVRLSSDTVIQPDVVIARRSDLTAKNLPAAPVLATEVHQIR